MNSPVKIWLSATYAPVYRCGGWASVRLVDGQRSGLAGGDRNITAGRLALAGLAAALRDLAAGAVVEIQTDSADLAPFARLLASLGAPTPTPTPVAAPEEDLDLWALILTAGAGRRLSLSVTAAVAATPLAFAAAWAELSRDKAKATGGFTATLPKPNLAKVQGMG
jgi:hypothetical protein